MQSDRELMQQALDALERCVATCFDQRAYEQVMSRPEHFVNQNITALRERLAQPEFDSALQSAAKTQTAPKLEQAEQECCQDTAQCLSAGVCVAKHGQQPEQSPLDRMAENARELGLDYEPVQEPVAWQWLDTGTFRKSLPASAEPSAWRALYTTPPRREWVGLTEEEIAVLWDVRHDIQGFARATEAKLREKNA